MTINELITQLAPIVAEHGGDTPIVGWIIAHPNALDSLDATKCQAGVQDRKSVV